jgi:hypothetical protein
MPSAKAWITLGILDYELSDKPAVLADVKKALALDWSIKRQFEQPPNAQPVRVSGSGQSPKIRNL